MRYVFLWAAGIILLAACDRSPPVESESLHKSEVGGSARSATNEISARRPFRENSFDKQQLELGRAVYNFRCYYCHGYNGDAKTLAATYLAPKPRDFLSATPDVLSLNRIQLAVRSGRTGTAMRPFSAVISNAEIEAVSAFVYDTFVLRKDHNTRYHTADNGWPNHDRYRAAFPFAIGERALNAEWGSLTKEEQQGLLLFRSSCITCHDRGQPVADAITWESRPLSYPRFNFDHQNPEVDAETSATPYRLHDISPRLKVSNPEVKKGESLWLENCAFCHAADGTGMNWIGRFLEPPPRNLTDPTFMSRVNRQFLRQRIEHGIPGTSMPAWRSVLSSEAIERVIDYIDAAFHPVQSGATVVPFNRE